jgi:hypothetical protein
MPSRFNSAPRARPVGPAPTITTVCSGSFITQVLSVWLDDQKAVPVDVPERELGRHGISGTWASIEISPDLRFSPTRNLSIHVNPRAGRVG